MSERLEQTPTGRRLAAAVAAHREGRLDHAEGGYRTVLRDDPGHGDAWHLLGLVHLGRGETAQAAACCAQAARRHPGIARYHITLGEALFRAGRYGEAELAARRATELDPTLAQGWYLLGRAQAVLGHDGATHSLKRCLDQDPSHPGALRALADAGETDILPSLWQLWRRVDAPEADRINIGFALATVLDRADDPDAAFPILAQANRLLHARLGAQGQ